MENLRQIIIKPLVNSTRQLRKVCFCVISVPISSLTCVIGLRYLDSHDPHLFKAASANAQFPPGSIYNPQVADAGGLVTVTDLPSALQALSTIVDQGEGKPGPGRPYDDDKKLEKDHYDIFLDLQQSAPTWEVLPVVTDPTTPGYLGEDPKIYAVRTITNSFD